MFDFASQLKVERHFSFGFYIHGPGDCLVRFDRTSGKPGGKKVISIANGEQLKSKESGKTPPRNQVTKAEADDQWRPGFCRDCFKSQRI